MIRKIIPLAAVSLFFLGTVDSAATAASRQPPTLLVTISVDQMRADYLDRFASEFHGGFARLLKEGAVFTQARQIHVPTETCPGHAAILTGRTPSENGIVGNNWWDRELGKSVYCVEDPVFGRSPLHLLSPTLGDALKAADPSAIVASFSEKDRAAILLGGHKPDVVVWYDSKSGNFVTSAYYGTLPSWVDKLNDQHLIERHYGISDLTAAVGVGTMVENARENVVRTPFADQLLEKVIVRAVDELKLGQHAQPDLLAISFSATDPIGHAYGPYSQEMHDNMVALDGTLDELFNSFDRAIGKGKYDVALTADHGVIPTAESPEGKAQGVRPIIKDEILAKIETLFHKKFPAAGQGNWVLFFSPPNLYLNREMISKSGLNPDVFLSRAAAALKSIPEVAEVFTPDQMNSVAGSSSRFIAAYERGWFQSRAGDLLIRFKENVLYLPDQSKAEHGSPYDYDARVPLIFMGPDIKPGRYDASVSVTDLAPTAAKILGLAFPPSKDSRVLDEILAN